MHPIGYAVACAYGSLVWAPFLVVWITKSLLLRYGGSKLYLNALPGFLGFALGYFVTAGLIWGLAGCRSGRVLPAVGNMVRLADIPAIASLFALRPASFAVCHVARPAPGGQASLPKEEQLVFSQARRATHRR